MNRQNGIKTPLMVLLSLALFFTFSPPGDAAAGVPTGWQWHPRLGTLKGRVTSAATGGPVTGITVKVFNRQLAVSQNGDYRAIDLPPHQYTVVVQGAFYGTQRKSVTVRAGETATLDFSLSPLTAKPHRRP